MEIKIDEKSVFTYSADTLAIGIHTHRDGKYSGPLTYEGKIVFASIEQINHFREMIDLLNERRNIK